MDVRVEELGVLGQLGPHDVLEALDEILCAPKDVLHGVGVYGRGEAGDLRAQVGEVRLRVDLVAPIARSSVSQRRELAPVAVDPAPERLVQRAELSRLELRVQLGQLLLDDAPDLHREHVPEGVGGEVPVGGARPVHVLEDAARVVGHLDAEAGRASSRSRPPAGRRARALPATSCCSSSKRRMMWRE